MNILTITWTGAEYNTFSYFTDCIHRSLAPYGIRCFDVKLGETFGPSLADITRKNRIDFAITFQGIGSNIQTQNNKNLWEELGIKLICLHGDHPCHAPVNHASDSSHIFHLYNAPNWALYAEKHFTRKHPVRYFIPPNFLNIHQPLSAIESDAFFVFPKNLNDTSQLQEEWKNKFPPLFSDFLIEALHAIADNYHAGDTLEHHSVIEQLLTPAKFAELTHAFRPASESAFFHFIHSLLDKVYRNVVSESVVAALQDVPMVIYGRGWERHQLKASRFHAFKTIENLADVDFQYQSQYGIIDVSPTRECLHDRTMRAMASGCGFLSSCQFDFTSVLGRNEPGLFYSNRKEDLREKVEKVMADPDAHRTRSVEWGRAFEHQFSIFEFLTFLR